MPPPLTVSVQKLQENLHELVPSLPFVMNFDDGLPAAGQMMFLVTAGQAQPTWVGKAGWTEVADWTDPNGHYAVHRKVSDGTETSITFTGYTGNYLDAMCAAFTLRPRTTATGVGPVIEHDYVDATSYTTPALAGAEGRMDILTGNVAPSNIPAPSVTAPWYEVGFLGNMAIGHSTVGWRVRYGGAAGEAWVNPQLVRTGVAIGVDLPAGGPTINMIGTV